MYKLEMSLSSLDVNTICQKRLLLTFIRVSPHTHTCTRTRVVYNKNKFMFSSQ